jgi:hypothetical protein
MTAIKLPLPGAEKAGLLPAANETTQNARGAMDIGGYR